MDKMMRAKEQEQRRTHQIIDDWFDEHFPDSKTQMPISAAYLLKARADLKHRLDKTP